MRDVVEFTQERALQLDKGRGHRGKIRECTQVSGGGYLGEREDTDVMGWVKGHEALFRP